MSCFYYHFLLYCII